MNNRLPYRLSKPVFLACIAVSALAELAPAQLARPEGAPRHFDAQRSQPLPSAAAPINKAAGDVASKWLGARPSRRDAAGHATSGSATRPAAIHFDAPGDGSIWVRGTDYKASFDTGGAAFIPHLGAHASRNRPVRFAPESASVGGRPIDFARSVPAARAGDAVLFDRTTFVEKYAIAPASMEQTFVFSELASRGELVLRLSVDTDLEAAVETSAGLRFACADGGVVYGRATAVDADGRTAPIESRTERGTPGSPESPRYIELRVPASFVSSARLPLTIDPVISTFAVDTTTLDNYSPDVAYDPSTNRYMVCYEEQYSATDHDVYEELLDSSGALISGNYIDISTDNWQHPRIANNAGASQFMVAAQVGAAPSRAIATRTASAGTNALGSQVTASNAFFLYDQLNPDIGGDASGDPDGLYLVVWEYVINNTGDRYIIQIGMHTNGLPDGGAGICVECTTGTRNFNPAISKSTGTTTGLFNRWTIVWEYEYSPTDHDIYGAQQANELLVVGPYAIDTSGFDERRPSVSSFADGSSAPGNYLVTYDQYLITDYDIIGQVMNGASSVAYANLSALEGPDFFYQDQVAPSADSDGCNFAVTYSELYGTSTTDYDVYVATFNLVGSTIDCIEAHQNLAYTDQPDVSPAITAAHGGPLLRYMGAWAQQVSGNSDIHGGLYDSATIVPYCWPGAGGVASCPCSNPPQGFGGCNNSIGTGGAVLAVTGTASLASDTLSLSQSGELPNALSIFLQGNGNLAAGTTFGDGVRCAGGTLKRLYVHNASAGSVSAPVGSDDALSVRASALGDTIQACQTRYYQIYYRDANLTFCPGGFNVGNGAKVTWLP